MIEFSTLLDNRYDIYIYHYLKIHFKAFLTINGIKVFYYKSKFHKSLQHPFI